MASDLQPIPVKVVDGKEWYQKDEVVVPLLTSVILTGIMIFILTSNKRRHG
jgi:hypothetical protein